MTQITRISHSYSYRKRITRNATLARTQVLTGAVDGVFTFTNGIVSTAKTGDITKLVGGTAGLVTKTVGGIGDGVSSVLRSVETGLQHVGGENTSQRDDDSPDNVVEGVVDGVKGIGGALIGSVTGFYTKNKKELAKSDGSVVSSVAAVTKGTTKAAVGALTGTVGSLFGAVRSTVEGATNTTKSVGGWFS